jgi:hypothetical protein
MPPDVDKGPEILIACGICFAVALFMVGLRVFTRLRFTRNFSTDDWFIVAAM